MNKKIQSYETAKRYARSESVICKNCFVVCYGELAEGLQTYDVLPYHRYLLIETGSLLAGYESGERTF